MNLLFICSRNQWRSPTAEGMFKRSQVHRARAAGTEPSARVRVNEQMLHWADIVYVMEYKHRERLKELFPETVRGKKIIVLDIEDNYQYNEPELIDILESALGEYLTE